MLYRTCTIISSIDLAHYGVFRAKIRYMWIVVQVCSFHYFALFTAVPEIFHSYRQD